ncbi:MAG: hypothetical protein IPQ07_39255 [Myxococcales bacterium]|nr:hypothetical protein [Myxococcales bacterium]
MMWRAGLVLLTGCAMQLSPGARSSGAGPTASVGTGDPNGGTSGDDPYRQDLVQAGPRKTLPPIHMAIPDRPVDPWTGVSGDRPATFADAQDGSQKRWEVPADNVACTAARDHCLPPISWMWVHEGDTGAIRHALVVAFTPEGPTTPTGGYGGPNTVGSDGYTAYRTVPATRGNLVPGATVVAYPYPEQFPVSPVEAFKALWAVGVVERVDWDLGFVFLAGWKEPQFLTAARVAVLSYQPGGKVTILDGRRRDQLAISPGDVMLPTP